MSVRGLKVINRIRRNLLEEANEENLVNEKTVEREIEKEAGFSSKTKSKYREKLEEYEYITEEEPGLYRVKELEKETPELSGKKTSVTFQIDEEIKKKAEELGIDKETVFTEALLDKIENKQEFLIQRGFSVSEEEAEIIFRWVAQDIYKENYSSDQERHKIGKMRAEIYLDVYDNKEKLTSKGDRNDYNHMSELQNKSFELAEILGKVDKPAEGL